MGMVIDFQSKEQIANTMSVERAEFIVGGGLMLDELESIRENCNDDPNIVEACDVIISVRHSRK